MNHEKLSFQISIVNELLCIEQYNEGYRWVDCVGSKLHYFRKNELFFIHADQIRASLII